MPRKSTAKDADVGSIGVRLRHARLTARMNMRDLADATGCSESYVSKVEARKVTPSVAMLHRLAHALGTNVSRLLDPAPHDELVQINRADDPLFPVHGGIGTGDGISLRGLVNPSLSRLLQANIHQVEPGGASDGQITHEGEEFGYILDGQLEITIGEETHSLARGDSFFFPSELPHGYRNPGDRPTTVLWVNTPATF